MSVPAQRVTEPLSALDRPHLADTTVWSKIQPHEALARWFNEEVRAGRILTCDVVALELLRSAGTLTRSAPSPGCSGCLSTARRVWMSTLARARCSGPSPSRDGIEGFLRPTSS